MDNFSTNTPPPQPLPPQNGWTVQGSANQPQESYQPASPQQTPGFRKMIAVIVLAVVVILAFVALVFWPKNCFRVDSYKDLVAMAQGLDGGNGLELSSVTQNKPLFIQSVYFQTGGTAIDPELSSTNPTEVFKKLGAYYKDHQETAPIHITLESGYQEGTLSDMAKLRMKVIKDNLVQAGVAKSVITVKDPVATTFDEDSEYDDDVIDGMPVGIQVTPVPRCTP